jgi:hypothetical protein
VRREEARRGERDVVVVESVEVVAGGMEAVPGVRRMRWK